MIVSTKNLFCRDHRWRKIFLGISMGFVSDARLAVDTLFARATISTRYWRVKKEIEMSRRRHTEDKASHQRHQRRQKFPIPQASARRRHPSSGARSGTKFPIEPWALKPCSRAFASASPGTSMSRRWIVWPTSSSAVLIARRSTDGSSTTGRWSVS